MFHKFLFLWLLPLVALSQDVLTPDECYRDIQQGTFDAVIDVRNLDEWNAGHLEHATFVQDLASTGTPERILNCHSCTLAVYCRSGSRAGTAIQRLQTEYGFQGKLYNCLGVSQWEDANYSLVQTESLEAPCTLEGYACAGGCCQENATSQTNSDEMSTASFRQSILSLSSVLVAAFFC